MQARKSNKIFYFLVVLKISACFSIFSSCRTRNANPTSKIIGIWTLELSPTDTIEFTSNGYYYDSKFNKRSNPDYA